MIHQVTEQPAASLLELQVRYETLTGQQKRVLKYILRHYRQQEICRILNITVNTLHGHRKEIHDKLSVSRFSGLSDEEQHFLFSATKAA